MTLLVLPTGVEDSILPLLLMDRIQRDRLTVINKCDWVMGGVGRTAQSAN